MGFCFLTGEFAQDRVVQRFRVMAMKHALQSGSACAEGLGGCQMCTILHTSFPCSLYTLNHLHISCNCMSYVLLCGSLYFHFFCLPKVSNKIRITIFRLQALYFYVVLFFKCMFQLFQTLDTSWDILRLGSSYKAVQSLDICWLSLRFPVFQCCVSTRRRPLEASWSSSPRSAAFGYGHSSCKDGGR